MAKHIVDAVAWQEACNGIHCFDCQFMQGTFCKIKQYIESQPEADPPRPHGEWIREVIVEEPRKNKRAYARCSSCGCLYNHYLVAVKHFDFCPKCGSDNRKEPAP